MAAAEAVDVLAALARGQLPVRDRGDVGQGVTDTGPHEADRGLTDDVEVDDDGDRVRHAVRATARVVVERRDGRAQAVVRQVRRDGDQRQADARRGELGAVDDLAAAEAHDRVVAALLDGLSELDRVVERPAADLEPLRTGQLRLEALAQDGARATADRDGQASGGRRDPLVGENGRQVVDRPRPDVDDNRRGDEPRQYWHAISRPLARSSWLSISTHFTSPIGATSILKPRFTSSW